METKNSMQSFFAGTREEWRKWLQENCKSEKSIWLIIYQKKSNTSCVHYRDAIEEAICFGWVDSKAIKRDEESCYLHFTQRNPRSTWSRINRERAEKMVIDGLMAKNGQALIDLAKKTGTWDALIDAQNLVIPEDLHELFEKNEIAFKNYQTFPPSSKRVILEWIMKANKPETRQRRIEQTVELAANNTRANHS